MLPSTLALVVAACTGATPTETADTDPPTPFDTADTGRDCSVADDAEWSLLADGFSDGVLLSAWDAGGIVRMVGGAPGSGPGQIVRYDGASLCTEPAVTESTLWWIHGSRRSEWYAVGENGTVLHDVDGVRTREDVPSDITLYGVYDDGARVWAVGGDPFALDSGEVWVRDSAPSGTWSLALGGISGVPFKVWGRTIVGDGVGLRIDPTAPADQALTPFDQTERLLTVRGRDDTDQWAVGGTAFPIVQRIQPGTDGSVAVSDVDPTGLNGPLNGVWTAPEQDVFVAGFSGTIGRFDGNTWDVPGTPVSFETFHAAWGTCGEVLFVGGNLLASQDFHATIARYGSGTFTVADVPTCQ